jgi:hypothetical protein
MTGVFGPTIILATLDILPEGRTRVKSRGYIAAPFQDLNPTQFFAQHFEHFVQLYGYRIIIRLRDLAIATFY